ncbi:MAG: hypothetical protein KBT67_03365 [bacterium]|nr:hypothetical protein [Candidatus Limimorpha caballi]
MKKLLLIMMLSVMMASCATIFSGTTAKVTVSTNAGEPVNLKVDGEQTYFNVMGPTDVKVRRGFKKSQIVAESENKYGSAEISKTFNPITLLNLFSIPGYVIDGISGAITKPNAKAVTIFMQAKNNQPKREEPKKEEPKKVVQGNGDTDLENAIVRWDVQSRPQGADLFWRVVSRTPEVKSTNNKYLQTTPYEATKALDIKGLTAEAASNVSIIIRCEKEGYMPQEKEFNVRMVLDQEEISAFFRLIKEGE